MASILCFNSGSSSLKFAVFSISKDREELGFSGAAESIGADKARFWLNAKDRSLIDEGAAVPDYDSAIHRIFSALHEHGLEQTDAVGHRIVHGGPLFRDPERVDASLLAKLKDLIPFAPLHLPAQIALMEGVARRSPELPQVACFDTAFHWRMPELARRFALPRNLWDEGIRRYGFHGLSYEYIVSTLKGELGNRAIIAHLGNGASMVALREGIPVDTSMGLTPTGGFMMGTRSGDLDPGVILYLLRKGRTLEELARLLDRQSGLVGVSGISSDMKTLLQSRAEQPSAAQAIEMFCYQVRKFIGAYAVVLNGLDTLVFTGGIGEHAAEIRAEICRTLEFLGVALDPTANQQHSQVISTAKSRCCVRIVKTDEDRMIARHTWQLFRRPETEVPFSPI